MSVSTKPPSGFRDFLPAEMRRRDHVFGVIESTFQRYGFDKLGTPCVENLSTLLGKYGDDGDQLLFRILNRGDKLTKAIDSGTANEGTLAEAGLRYDLTVPLARVYAKYQNDLPRIFKRYQIAPVWRADRPQKGRYREFYQCDVDVVGSTSMVVEVEVASALVDILTALEFDRFKIHVNHRGILSAMIEASGIASEMESTTLVALDKLDKIGMAGVNGELEKRGLSAAQIERLNRFVAPLESDNRLAEFAARFEETTPAFDELAQMLKLSKSSPAGSAFFFDPTLARGLSYYTGPIFEIRSDDFSGSLGGGGRYDGLIGMFLKNDVPACGFSLGVERILVLMEERGLKAGADSNAADAMLSIFSDDTTEEALALAAELRASGMRVDVFSGNAKMGKQFAYADRRGIPFVLTLGPSEIAANKVAVKELATGEQTDVPRDDVVSFLSKE